MNHYHPLPPVVTAFLRGAVDAGWHIASFGPGPIAHTRILEAYGFPAVPVIRLWEADGAQTLPPGPVISVQDDVCLFTWSTDFTEVRERVDNWRKPDAILEVNSNSGIVAVFDNSGETLRLLWAALGTRLGDKAAADFGPAVVAAS